MRSEGLAFLLHFLYISNLILALCQSLAAEPIVMAPVLHFMILFKKRADISREEFKEQYVAPHYLTSSPLSFEP